MSDEQAAIMIGLLTEIQDELRLVRAAVMLDKDHVTIMRTLWENTGPFNLARAMMAQVSQVPPINAVASQRVPVPETP